MSEQPHIIVFLSDQHNPQILECEGDAVRTPALDRLARRGVRLENCYTGYPLCVPARSNFLTGQACHRLGIWGNDDPLSSNTPTFAHALSMEGYRTVLVGRMHFVGDDQKHGFQERLVGDVTSGYIGVNRAEDRYQGYYGLPNSLENPGPGRSVDQEFDTAVAMRACQVIRDHEVSGDSRPLCMVVGLYSPHDPYRAYGRFCRMYEGDLPVDPTGENLHPFNRAGRWGSELPEENIREARRCYRAKVSFMDELIGRVLERLQQSSLGDNALCIYTSDHGDMIGEHGLWAKGTFYDPSARVPMIVSWPGRLPEGERRDTVVGLGDVAPTLVELTGGEPLPHTDGRSFWPLLERSNADVPGCAYSESCGRNNSGPARMVRKGRWKLNYYENYAPELFDVEADPHEMQNLAEQDQYAGTVDELTDLVFADGWDPETIREEMERRTDNYQYMRRWAKEMEPEHPVQWARPAQL
ncbi:MAG: sulfatase-like hydrolase/transferase [Planctomycetota bacterium]